MERSAMVEIDGRCSQYFKVEHGTVQGSVLGPILFAIFISPMFDLYAEDELNSFADDSYLIQTGKDEQLLINKVVEKATTLIKWFEDSGMKVNVNKTELCIFHKSRIVTQSVVIKGHTIPVSEEMKVLGVVFDRNLKWDNHIIKTIKSCSKLLFALRILRQSLDNEQLLNIATSIFYSRMYYASIVWLHKNTSSRLKQKLLSLSAKCLMICLGYKNRDGRSFDEIHKEAERATPKMFQLFIHSCFMYKLFHEFKPITVYNKLITTFLNEHRNPNPKFTTANKTKVGLNSLHNRLSEISNIINFNWMDISYPHFKILAKKQFLSFQ